MVVFDDLLQVFLFAIEHRIKLVSHEENHSSRNDEVETPDIVSGQGSEDQWQLDCNKQCQETELREVTAVVAVCCGIGGIELLSGVTVAQRLADYRWKDKTCCGYNHVSHESLPLDEQYNGMVVTEERHVKMSCQVQENINNGRYKEENQDPVGRQNVGIDKTTA